MRPMKTTVALAIVAILATGCFNPFAADPDPTLEIFVSSRNHLTRYRPNDTTRVLARQAIDDPRGFAGLEIVIGGEDMPTRRYTASHFASVGETKFRVPDKGFATVSARVVQDGRIVAEVSERWGLGSKIQWSLDVARAPWPPGQAFPGSSFDPANPECEWFWCFAVWRSLVAEDVANYEGEALWVTLYRHHPDECVDLC